MNSKLSSLSIWLSLSLLTLVRAAPEEAGKPNIVFVLCDDLGYGEIHCLNPERGKIPTPAVDRLAKEGMIFTDAHSGSSVCTPTRYGLLTGRYSWRTWLQSGVVQGFVPCLIAPERPTVASFLKAQGYHTGIIGKWHLNFQFEDGSTGELLKPKGKKTLAPVGSKIPDGPLTRGFDYYYGFHHAGSMKALIENDTVIAHDDEIKMLPRLSKAAVEFIDDRAKMSKEEPFFLYLPYGSPHSPVVPTKEWQGKSGLNKHADFVMETDEGFGAILDALDRNGFTDNTLVIFSSDNGTSTKTAKIPELNEMGHYPNANLRGAKADLWKGGHRVPFVARWPEKIQPGSTSDQLIYLVDFFATCADILDQPVADNCAEDSVSFLSALKGEPIVSSRKGIVHHSIDGYFAYREDKWKILLARGSGGWSKQGQKAGAPIAQLYDMESDIGETKNLYESNPEVAARLIAQLTEYVEAGASVAGKNSKNDTNEIVLWKSGNE